MSHYREVCKKCGATISQCRCPSNDKETRYSLCEKCKTEKPIMNREELIEVLSRFIAQAECITDNVRAANDATDLYDRIAAFERREGLRETLGTRPESCFRCDYNELGNEQCICVIQRDFDDESEGFLNMDKTFETCPLPAKEEPERSEE